MLDRQNEPLGPNAEDDVATLARKVDYLSRSDSYISAPETVTVRETYILVWFRCQWPTTGYAIGGEVPP